MPSPPPKRPWHRRKRIWGGAALWLVVAYPLSLGPAVYCVARGWGSLALIKAAYAPVFAVAIALDPNRAGSYGAYVEWCGDLGERHRRAASN